MKVLFICKFDYVEKPGIMYLSAFLKNSGHECYYLDTRFERNLVREVKKINPGIIAYSVSTGPHKYLLEINRKLKKHFNFFAIFGGPHCTVFPEFIEEESIDAICRGEGEEALYELAENLEKGEDYTQIRNLWIKKDGKIFKNDLRPLVENLDDLPIPDREIFDRYRHFRYMHRRFLMTSRGCPYNCTYCFNNLLRKVFSGKGTYMRQRSVKNVIEELKLVKEKYRPKRIKFYDDVLIYDRKWILKFCEEYAKEIKLPFITHVRVNLVTEEIVRALKNAGCITVEYGIESGNPEIRNRVLKRNLSNEAIINASLLFKKYKIKTLSFNIVGLPDETVDNCIETIKLNIQSKVTYSHVLIYTPYPLTDLCNYAISKGYLEKGFTHTNSSFIYSNSVLKMKDIMKIKRVQYLFSVMVLFPFLLPLLKILTAIPLNPVYQLIYFTHRIVNHFFLTKQIDWQEVFITEWCNKKKL